MFIYNDQYGPNSINADIMIPLNRTTEVWASFRCGQSKGSI